MERCSATTATGLRCKRNAKTDGKCTQHAKLSTTAVLMCGHRWEGMPDRRCNKTATHGLFCLRHEEVPEEHQCTLTRGGVKCIKRKKAGHDTLCPHHFASEEALRYVRFREDNFTRFRTLYQEAALAQGIAQETVNDGHYIFRIYAVALVAIRHKFRNPAATDAEIMALYPVPQPVQRVDRTELARLAHDNQNVHTAAVSEQTNKGIEKLMKVPVPPAQQTMVEIRAAWDKIYTIRKVDERIYIDMNIWYTQPTCCKANDWLYKNLLDHLWAKITAEPKKDVKRELHKRLQQECAESYGMCCIGHINRLINVLVGFDEEFKPQISKNEILQNKFAEISKILDDTEKYLQATAVLGELGVVGDEAAVWMDALV